MSELGAGGVGGYEDGVGASAESTLVVGGYTEAIGAIDAGRASLGLGFAASVLEVTILGLIIED